LSNPKTQRYLIWIGALGVLTSCMGCSLIVANQPGQLTAARVFLIAGEVILVPLFVYLILLRNRASATYTRRLRKQEARKQRELEALASVEGTLAANQLQQPQHQQEPDNMNLPDPRPPTPDP
jgi:hypothetical protein